MILAPGAKCTRAHCFASNERSYSESSARSGTEASSRWNRSRRHIISTSCTARVRTWNALALVSPSAPRAVAASYAPRSTTRHAAPLGAEAATEPIRGSSTKSACSPKQSPGSRIDENAPNTSSPSALAHVSPRAHGASSSTAAAAPGRFTSPRFRGFRVKALTIVDTLNQAGYPPTRSRSQKRSAKLFCLRMRSVPFADARSVARFVARSVARRASEPPAETKAGTSPPRKLVAAPRKTKNISRRSSSSSPSRTIISPRWNVLTRTPCASLANCASLRLSKMGTRRRISTFRRCSTSRSAPVSASRIANIKP